MNLWILFFFHSCDFKLASILLRAAKFYSWGNLFCQAVKTFSLLLAATFKAKACFLFSSSAGVLHRHLHPRAPAGPRAHRGPQTPHCSTGKFLHCGRHLHCPESRRCSVTLKCPSSPSRSLFWQMGFASMGRRRRSSWSPYTTVWLLVSKTFGKKWRSIMAS